jgi:Zn-dependent protease with chaperone function
MDFFGAQDRARRLSGWLVALFALAVVLIVGTVYLAIALAWLGGVVWSPGLLAATAAGVGLVVGVSSSVRTAGLRSGGGASVAEMLGGRALPSAPEDPAERRLLNVVEEIALAAGVAVPSVYVLEQEPGINAFAAGYGPSDAVVAVTRGALEAFDRDELQGVVAHEFSHIVNRDIRLNIQLTGLIFGILALGLAGRILLRSAHFSGGARRDGRAAVAVLAVGLTLFVAGYTGVLLGRIIRAAVSRQREYLADAAAVQFTRNPEGLASALRKVGAQGSRLETPAAEEVSHFFFANGLRSGVTARLWGTHPPLEERIQRLDPRGSREVRESPALPPASPADPRLAGLAGPAAGPAPRVREDPPAAPEEAAARLAALPEALRAAVHDPFSAVALTYALMLDREPGARDPQRDLLRAAVSEPIVREVTRLQPAVDALPGAGRLALVDLAAPALRQLSQGQAEKLATVLADLARADRRLSVFEFSLETAVRHRLAAAHGGAGHGHALPFEAIRSDALVVLSALAHAGQRAPEAVQAAFAGGIEALLREEDSSGRRRRAPSRERPVACTAGEVHAALDRLADARDGVRRRVLDACVATVLYDRTVTADEGHLLRAIATALDVPAPEFLPGLEPE